MLLFDVLLFQPRLNFRRREEAEDVVTAVVSSGLDSCGGVTLFSVRATLCALGPVSLGGLASTGLSATEKSPLVLDLGIIKCSP